MGNSIALAAYLAATRFADRWAERKLEARKAEGKEDPERINERYGRPTRPRPKGALIWFHAASVGESLSVLELLSQIKSRFPSMSILVTTGTRSSAEILNTRLPDAVIHQYVPVDTRSAVTGFLDHWKPDIAVWTESELWPRLMTQTHDRGIPMVLINGRISEKTAETWKWLPGMSKSLLDRFDAMHVQNEEIATVFREIGGKKDRITVSGSLKEGAIALPHDEIERKNIQKQIGTRPVWFAGSTHDGEEEIIVEAHKLVRVKRPELLLILAPRHPERKNDVAGVIDRAGLTTAIRSLGDVIKGQTDVYLADTLGEMGLWYRIAPVSFVGGSLTTIGGHNPFEPAALGSAILYGPNVDNFADIYQRLHDGLAAVCVRSADELAEAVHRYLQPDQAAVLATAAWEVSSDGAGATEKVFDLLKPYIEKALEP